MTTVSAERFARTEAHVATGSSKSKDWARAARLLFSGHLGLIAFSTIANSSSACLLGSGEGGGPDSIRARISSLDTRSPLLTYGGVPSKSWYSIAPIAYTSDGGPSFAVSPRACSGGM
jgi:hypothetical protein